MNGNYLNNGAENSSSRNFESSTPVVNSDKSFAPQDLSYFPGEENNEPLHFSCHPRFERMVRNGHGHNAPAFRKVPNGTDHNTPAFRTVPNSTDHNTPAFRTVPNSSNFGRNNGHARGHMRGHGRGNRSHGRGNRGRHRDNRNYTWFKPWVECDDEEKGKAMISDKYHGPNENAIVTIIKKGPPPPQYSRPPTIRPSRIPMLRPVDENSKKKIQSPFDYKSRNGTKSVKTEPIPRNSADLDLRRDLNPVDDFVGEDSHQKKSQCERCEAIRIKGDDISLSCWGHRKT